MYIYSTGTCTHVLVIITIITIMMLKIVTYLLYHLLSSSCCCYYLALLSTNCSCIIVSSWKHFLHFPSFILKVPYFFGWSHFFPMEKDVFNEVCWAPTRVSWWQLLMTPAQRPLGRSSGGSSHDWVCDGRPRLGKQSLDLEHWTNRAWKDHPIIPVS